MRRWTEFVLAHRKLVILVWLLFTVAGSAAAGPVVNKLTYDYSMPGQPGDRAAHLVSREFGNGGLNTPYVLTITYPAGQQVSRHAADVAHTFAEVGRRVPGLRVVDQANTGDSTFVTADGRTAYALVFYPYSSSPTATLPTASIRSALSAASPAGVQTGLTSRDLLANGSSSSGSGVVLEVTLGALGALLVLVWVFASFLALLPLLIAAAAIMTTFLFLWPMTSLGTFSGLLEFLITLVGLGVAVDYSLLCVTRWREERAHGRDNHDAVLVAMQTAGKSVIISGLTVGIGLLSLLVLPVPFLRTTGLGGALIPLTSIAAAVSLTPAILGGIGPRLDWPRLRNESSSSRPWNSWATRVTRAPKVAALASGAVLLGLIVALFGINVGQSSSSSLSKSGAASTALHVLQQGGVPTGILTPIEIPTRQESVHSAVRTLRSVPGVRTVLQPDDPTSTHRGTVLLLALPERETVDSASVSVVRRLRTAASSTTGVLGVAGVGATQLDFIHAVYGNFPLMLAVIALLTFLLLARSFRSIVLPLKAVLLNLLSLGATFGGMVLFWQRGHGSGTVFGVSATGAITFWIPLIVFAFLFGLSMDYEVFILARIREEFDRTGSTATAVVQGMARTGRLVPSAALILFLAFVAMSAGPGTDLKVMATGLGFGILVDATIVRSLLLPALVTLLGRANWWWPSWLDRVLRVRSSRVPAPSV